jgi:hypothetical protein
MKYSCTLFFTAVSILVTSPSATAKSTAAVKNIAQATTVEIKLQLNKTVGSGVIIAHQGDLYTIATNRHVVCAQKRCNTLPSGEKYSLGLADGKQYKIEPQAIKLAENGLDLAVIQFRSSRNYAVAQIAQPDSLKANDLVYTAGFPFEEPGFSFNEGKAIAVVNKRLQGDSGGYSVIYDAATLPGMSGGGVFDRNGYLVAIHGLGDRYRQNAVTSFETMELTNTFNTFGSKAGVNRGIPTRWLTKNTGVNSDSKETNLAAPVTADELFISGFNKSIDPGENVKAARSQSIQEFRKAIQLNPQYFYAYYEIGRLYQ